MAYSSFCEVLKRGVTGIFYRLIFFSRFSNCMKDVSTQVYVPSRQISGRSIKMHSDTSGKLLAEFSSDFWPTFLSFIRQVSEKLGADCEKRIPRRLDRC